jgi:hypothetical protein
VHPALEVDALAEGASLVYDLGLDSLRLEELAALVKRELSSADLTPWYVRASGGHDSVGELVDFLLRSGRFECDGSAVSTRSGHLECR